MGITKAVLKRPVTAVLAILCLLVFGLSAVLSSRMELTPEMNFPMVMVTAVYSGAQPADVNELVTKPIEESVGTLSGIKNVQSISRENVSMVMLEYEYGTNMDQSYSDLRKKMDSLRLPDDVLPPVIIEFNRNDAPSMTIAAGSQSPDNLYHYVNDEVVPELEKLSSVAGVDVTGGRENYVSVRLMPEKLSQYRLNMNSISQAIAGADFTYPAGSIGVGKQDLSVSASVKVDTIESLKKIPLPVGNAKTVSLEDVADISEASGEQTGIGRYNGRDTISLSVHKQQKSSAVDVSKAVNQTIERLEAAHPGLQLVVVNDSSGQIKSALSSVALTMGMAVLISMIIIYLFFGDFKASLIVGSSIPVSILAALILMSAMGFSLNVVTMGGLVLGVGMMVDNSIVVLESCFRSRKGQGFREYMQASCEGTQKVISSIFGGTVTTCVVFIPLALLKGLSGQLFAPLGFTIVFCMAASLICAMTIVPLCYSRFRPAEKQNSPAAGLVRILKDGYRKAIGKLLNRRKTVIAVSVLLLLLPFAAAASLGFALMPEVDQGTVAVTVDMRPGLKIEEADKILRQVEKIAMDEPDRRSLMISYGGNGLSVTGGASLTAYLKPDRTLTTAQVVDKWKKEMGAIPDCSITVKASSTMSSFGEPGDLQVILQSPQLDALKAVSGRLVEDLTSRPELMKVHSDLENAAPVLKVSVDSMTAAAMGIIPNTIGTSLRHLLSGVKAAAMDVNGDSLDVRVEYPKNEYDTLEKLEGITLPSQNGGQVALMDIAKVDYEDSPAAITRKNKQYQATITGSFTDQIKTAGDKAEALKNISGQVVGKYLNGTVIRAQNSVEESMYQEFSALLGAIATAVFLIFVVMAAQFESPKFSLMVMTTIPLSLIGSFGLLVLTGVEITMPSLLGFLMLVGTVVNAGILYVDTVNQNRLAMDKRTAIIEAGVIRLRPILMTTLTTAVSMIPMAIGFGSNGEIMQGLALVNAGGLAASTVLSLLMLPVYYSIMSGKDCDHLFPD